MIHHLVLGGTGESYPGDLRTEVPPETMLHHVTKHLDPDHFTSHWVGYPAEYAGSMDYNESVQLGVVNAYLKMVDILSGGTWDHEGDRLWLTGYSQGATIARRFNEALTEADNYRSFVAGVSCVADPHRPEGVALGFDPGGSGVGGPVKWDPEVPMLQVAASRDPICASAANSYIRTVADFTGFLAFNPDDLHQWARDTIRRIEAKGWQNANLDWGQFWLTGMRVAEAVDGLRGYLPMIPGLNPGGGRHTCYGVERMPNSPFTYCERLAQEMNTIARREGL